MPATVEILKDFLYSVPGQGGHDFCFLLVVMGTQTLEKQGWSVKMCVALRNVSMAGEIETICLSVSGLTVPWLVFVWAP
jgi:hypothetical protein